MSLSSFSSAELLDVRRAASLLALSQRRTRMLAAGGQLGPTAKTGAGHWLLNPDAVRAEQARRKQSA